MVELSGYWQYNQTNVERQGHFESVPVAFSVKGFAHLTLAAGSARASNEHAHS